MKKVIIGLDDYTYGVVYSAFSEDENYLLVGSMVSSALDVSRAKRELREIKQILLEKNP
ncbi:hypothetical protein [Lactococcus garvieae]|uniref:hypothetical protein n=1 Tax=Lactococcus garvieae TaxID=1363 RepID=UPI0018D782D4|nr:hypothetical protein [Lactococcus garvieae]QPS72129.1 hypothetical protein I6G50_05380 [Lactococcus garvieae]